MYESEDSMLNNISVLLWIGHDNWQPQPQSSVQNVTMQKLNIKASL